jgi:hypothetical protein
MATYVKKRSTGLTIFLIVLVLAVLTGIGVGSWYVMDRYFKGPDKPVTQGDISDLEARLAAAEARVAAVEGEARAEFWWTVAKWVLVIGSATFLVWYWIKRKFESTSGKLTIDEALKLGEKELMEKLSFPTKYKYGKSVQRREGSDDRILLLVFSRFQLIPGTTGMQSGLMYYAVVNRSWEERYPSEPGMTFMQFMHHLRDLEVIGFSVQKEEELAGLLKLKEKAEALSNAGNLAADLGIASPE